MFETKELSTTIDARDDNTVHNTFISADANKTYNVEVMAPPRIHSFRRNCSDGPVSKTAMFTLQIMETKIGGLVGGALAGDVGWGV